MSHDDSPNVPAPSDRREAVREKAQKVKAKHARAHTARLVILVVLAIVVVAAIVIGVVLAVTSQTAKPTAFPLNIDSDGGVAITSIADPTPVVAPTATPAPTASAPAAGTDAVPAPTESASPTTAPTPGPTSASTVDIRIYVDYLASGAKDFEIANTPQLTKWFAAGSATLTYYPVAILTAKSNGTKYSLRAAAAAACVANYSPASFYAFSHQLLLQQPGVDSAGLDDTALGDLAASTGATSADEVRECIEDGTFVSWARGATDAALAGIPATDGVTLTGAPLVLVNGQEYQGSLTDPKEFAQFVLTTASDSYYRGTPSPTPKP
ncbi:thioredoxin domain-containing protein [Microbacterium sp. SORGH_AS_0888]|uniref:DsbA family protein n=1 Tax=Microbacterium sp. SORGH_AS_0888 TaxID=3041791 RepID=UPI0027804B6F|nr:thioredoxin domain-containing protein [Microbacterium sp. SORGH_AS_0888]MDQ1131083.1 protein-disulfide isomerase [Microbacterium sp. SORGH_AS_0888]